MASVKVYSTKVCPWCEKMKQHLKEKSIKFENIDVSTNQAAQKEMIELSGQMGVPVTVIGETVIVGFDKDAVEEALKASK
ncbi:glutathione S-transferase N-terminal domain-containing protein [Candidatus Woesearchaeota archaeon]|nr:glutathione S-transferase N-terminal domain-containing protein [Candidatus Woesearchaeota archaeon]